MKVYFYHTQDTHRVVREWRQGKFPAHFLYGALQLEKYGLDVIYHDQFHTYKRFRDTWRATWRILTCREKYDVLYATHTRGIELIVLLHALGLYRPNIVVWHHQPIVKAKSRLREALAKFYYKGLDHMIFFSQKLIDDSLRSEKSDKNRMSMIPWGADLDYYKSITLQTSGNKSADFTFISTGKEMRDYETLAQAFNSTGLPLRLFVMKSQQSYFEQLKREHNIELNYCDHLMPHELSFEVAKSQCVCICCKPSNYTVGLTTVVEAMALGLPIVCTRNAQMPMDIEAEGIGLWVDTGDMEGWKRAIMWMNEHPEEAHKMGQRGQRLACETYNVQVCGKMVAEIIKSFKKK